MYTIVDFCLIPLEAGLSLSPYIAQCQKIFTKHNLKIELHAYGTNIEGDWDTIMMAIKECHVEIHKMDVPRISSTLKIGSRIDRQQSMAEKVQSVKDKI